MPDSMIFSVSEMTKPFKSFKDAEQKRHLAEDAAFTLKRNAEIKKDVKAIKADPELLAAAKEVLRKEIDERKTALAT